MFIELTVKINNLKTLININSISSICETKDPNQCMVSFAGDDNYFNASHTYEEVKNRVFKALDKLNDP